MKKRLLSFLLAVALVLTLLPAAAVQARAASAFTSSDELINIIKKWEGFSAKPYWDVSHWSIGYGTTVPDDKVEEYKANGITEAEAEAALRSYMTDTETRVNSFIDTYSLQATQGMFDAMVSLSYNCGIGWLYKTSTLRTAIIEGWTGNDLLFAFGQWSTAAGSTRTSLINRRMSECNMYLNGIYSKDGPENYSYVLFDANGGESEIITQCYDTGTTEEIRAVPTYEGYTFEGWYTDATGGEKVTKLDATVAKDKLFAHWSANQDTTLPESQITGTTVNYERTVATGTLNAFHEPVSGAAVVGSYSQGDQVRITAEYTDAGGTVWGKTGEGWINLNYTTGDGTQDTMSVKVTVTGNSVNIRRGPSTSYGSVKQVNKGYTLTITQTQTGGGYTWGKSSEGWIALKYTNFSSVSGGSTSEDSTSSGTTEDKVIATGKVTVDTKLNVRKGPSTGYAVVTTLKNNTAVEIYETKLVGTVTWGRISKGWISLDYVKLDSTESSDNSSDSSSDSSSGSSSDSTTSGQAGTITGDSLRIRSGAGTSYAIRGYLNTGDKVTILETKTVSGTQWGRIEKGWICMDYVKLDSTESSGSSSSGGSVSGGIAEKTGTVNCGTAQLRIRTEPGANTVAGYLNTGDKVTILETKTVDGTEWGRIEKGWIMMKYVVLDSASDTTTVAGTVTGDSLRIRSGAGTSYAILGFLNTGDKVIILETKTVSGTQWGRIEKGWICMDYAKTA